MAGRSGESILKNKGVTVIGDAFVDLLAPAYDIVPGNTYHRDLTIKPGGTAVVASLLASGGVIAKFAGKVGGDVMGRYFRENLASNKVVDLTLVDRGRRTGICLSLLDSSGERTMIADRGANDYLTIHDLDSVMESILDSDFVFFSGYSLVSEISSVAVLHAMEKCRHRCSIIFNPGAPNIIRESFKEIISEYVDFLVLSYQEAIALTGEEKHEAMAGRLSEMSGLCAVTTGEKGCILIEGDHIEYISTTRLSGAANTTGAGDAFSAGFILKMVLNGSPAECARSGNSMAGEYIEGRLN
jgi:sugar/nucleoside kinase (ribokinase family)